MTGVARTHAQRSEVVDRARERLTEVVPFRPNLRHAHLPRLERLANALPLFAEMTLDHVWSSHLCALRRRCDVDPQVPGLPWREDHVELDRRPVDAALLGEHDLRAAVSVRVDEHEPVLRILEARRDRVGQRLRVARIAEGEVPCLDRDDVREVGAELDPDPDRELLRRDVRECNVILHAVADEALTLDRHGVERKILRQRIPQEERGGVVLDRARGEQKRPPAVERQLQPREEARVVHEEPVSLLTHVAQLVADAEGRPFENGLFGH